MSTYLKVQQKAYTDVGKFLRQDMGDSLVCDDLADYAARRKAEIEAEIRDVERYAQIMKLAL